MTGPDELAARIASRRKGPAPSTTPPARGHVAPPGHQKVTVNFRAEVWSELQSVADEVGTPPVCLLEALVEKLLGDEKLRARIEDDAAKVALARRRLARRRP